MCHASGLWRAGRCAVGAAQGAPIRWSRTRASDRCSAQDAEPRDIPVSIFLGHLYGLPPVGGPCRMACAASEVRRHRRADPRDGRGQRAGRARGPGRAVRERFWRRCADGQVTPSEWRGSLRRRLFYAGCCLNKSGRRGRGNRRGRAAARLPLARRSDLPLRPIRDPQGSGARMHPFDPRRWAMVGRVFRCRTCGVWACCRGQAMRNTGPADLGRS